MLRYPMRLFQFKPLAKPFNEIYVKLHIEVTKLFNEIRSIRQFLWDETVSHVARGQIKKVIRLKFSISLIVQKGVVVFHVHDKIKRQIDWHHIVEIQGRLFRPSKTNRKSVILRHENAKKLATSACKP